jgi:hypothetical protein
VISRNINNNNEYSNNNSVQFDSILIYILANITAQRPIKKLLTLPRIFDDDMKQG